MKLQQLSVFLENRPGQLGVPVNALAEAGINILTMSVAETTQFGILRRLHLAKKFQRRAEGSGSDIYYIDSPGALLADFRFITGASCDQNNNQHKCPEQD